MEWNEFNKTLAVYCLSLHEPNSPIIPILKALIEVCERNQTLKEELEAMNKELEELRATIIQLQQVLELDAIIHPPLGSDKPVE